MIDLFCILNERTYKVLLEAFPEVEWQRHRHRDNYDYWVTEVEHDLATEIAEVAKEAGLSVGEEDAQALGLRKRVALS